MLLRAGELEVLYGNVHCVTTWLCFFPSFTWHEECWEMNLTPQESAPILTFISQLYRSIIEGRSDSGPALSTTLSLGDWHARVKQEHPNQWHLRPYLFTKQMSSILRTQTGKEGYVLFQICFIFWLGLIGSASHPFNWEMTELFVWFLCGLYDGISLHCTQLVCYRHASIISSVSQQRADLIGGYIVGGRRERHTLRDTPEGSSTLGKEGPTLYLHPLNLGS